jgi:hypothetical protein
MHVIVLHRKVHDTKPLRSTPIRPREREPQRRENMPAPQRSEGRPQRHVDGMSRLVRRKSAMWGGGTPFRPSPTGARAFAAPRRRQRKRELALHRRTARASGSSPGSHRRRRDATPSLLPVLGSVAFRWHASSLD